MRKRFAPSPSLYLKFRARGQCLREYDFYTSAEVGDEPAGRTRDRPPSSTGHLVDIREPLSEEELTQLAARYPDIHLAREEEFHRREEHDSGLFLIKSGRVQAYRLSLLGKRLTVAMFSSGSVFSERRMRGVYAQAMEPSVVCFVRRRDLNLLVGRRPELGLRLIDLLSDDLRMMDELLYDVVYKEVPARLASLILRLLSNEGVVNREGYKIPTY